MIYKLKVFLIVSFMLLLAVPVYADPLKSLAKIMADKVKNERIKKVAVLEFPYPVRRKKVRLRG